MKPHTVQRKENLQSGGRLMLLFAFVSFAIGFSGLLPQGIDPMVFYSAAGMSSVMGLITLLSTR